MRASLLPLTLALPATAQAAIDAFVCIEGMTGKSGTCALAVATDLTAANGWIPTAAVTVAAGTLAPEAAPHGGGTPADRPVEITLTADTSSPLLLLAALDGTSHTAHVAFRRAGGAKTVMPYLQLDFASVKPYVARTASSENGTTFTLAFDATGETKLTYRDTNGAVTGTYTWSNP